MQEMCDGWISKFVHFVPWCFLLSPKFGVCIQVSLCFVLPFGSQFREGRWAVEPAKAAREPKILQPKSRRAHISEYVYILCERDLHSR